MERMLLEYREKYPLMTLQDAVRLVYEAAFGPENEEDDRIEKEGSALGPEQLARPYTEALCGGYCRMNLSVLQVLPAGVLGKMAQISVDGGDEELYRQGLEVLARSRALGFWAHEVKTYQKQPPIRPPHSPAFEQAYAPAYRVIREELGRYLGLIVRICRLLYTKGEVTVAIDGQSAAGKTTLAALLKEVFDCNVFRTEDFMRDGWFDCQKFEQRVLAKLNSGKPFSCGGQKFQPRRLNVAEGLYSMHPSLQKYYELKVYMGVSSLVQSERILKREGESRFGRYAGQWLPRENAYLERMKIALKSDLVYHDEGGYAYERSIARAVGF